MFEDFKTPSLTGGSLPKVITPVSALLERLSARLELSQRYPLIPLIDVSTDPGDDNDDVLKVVASSFFQLTTFNQIAAIVERAPARERALLMQGAMNSLGIKGVELAVGSNYSYGSGPMHELAQSMIINRDQSFVNSSILLKSALEVAQPRSLTLLGIGGLKDLRRTMLLEPRLFQEKVSHVVFMGGVSTLKDRILEAEPRFSEDQLPDDLDNTTYKLAFGHRWRRLHPQIETVADFENTVFLDEDGQMTAEARAANNKFDYNSASTVYTTLQTWGIPMVVFTRHAANAMRFPRDFYDDIASSTNHPVAIYLRDFQRDILKSLWWRTWQSGLDREGLPPACTPDWFGKTFCENPNISQSLTADQDPWPYVKSFAPYDVGAFFAADPRLRHRFFNAEQIVVGGQTHQVIGVSAKVHGVRDSAAATKFLIDTVRGGFLKSFESMN